jgi:hypothetical protein
MNKENKTKSLLLYSLSSPSLTRPNSILHPSAHASIAKKLMLSD